MRPDFADALSALVNWVQKDALPLWLEKGLHTPEGWFSAHLSRAGQPLEGAPIQLLAQAQMLYLLARAEHLGWVGGRRKIARQLIDFAGRHGTSSCRSDGYVRSLEAPSVVLDSRYDPVDHAWFVIANTACFAAFGEMSDLRRAYNILDWLHIHFADGTTWKGIDGKTEAAPELYRHMLRAFLYLAEITQKPAWHQRASTLFAHCAEKFSLPTAPVAVDTSVEMAWRERLEWVRLLCRCQRVLGVGVNAAESFYRQVLTADHLPTVSGAETNGEVQAEVVAAGVALLAAGVNSVADTAQEQLECFLREYIVRDVPGVFVDEPGREVQGSGSLATLVRLADAAILAQQVLARAKQSG